MTTPDKEHDALLLEVAQLYYEQNRTQDDIGRQLHLTRWKIGRLLDEARKCGIVRIQIVHPQARQSTLELELSSRFDLTECIVVRTHADLSDQRAQVAKAAADYLQSRGSQVRTLGVSWGNTMQDIAAALPSGWSDGVEVIQINGSISRSIKPTTAANVATSIAHSAHGHAVLLPVPAIVEQVSTKHALDSEPFMREVLDKGRTADVLLFSLGALDANSVLVQSGAISSDELERLQSAGACGDVLAHYITPDGTLADTDLESRTMGLSLDDLRAARCSVAVAAGLRKVDVVAGALRNGLCSVLITDEETARTVLERKL
ncbi:transcriptional regulator [Rhodococcus sp. 06-412-2C]|uniref:sugar-binding transcriptional regulator n=1 Tax=unclassified Rhodococcus (in: high G+C Gram-positive bacteria) TaxID=192944 RepID=UPI000B9BCA72|nr:MULTISPECIES: sugar-binding transcriptional regulator [unclassified Rhodococcus (in: high G+C Gram-positive bacteria)]OZC88883.1 transcriptional regulator [Rhodococcus sp. 06-412-2C]OZD03248.1 transcriptional regulator [Rhodococcus sp. 06-412-2B]